jgi:hypothetical protein
VVGQTLAVAGIGAPIGYAAALLVLSGLGLVLLILGIRRSRAHGAPRVPRAAAQYRQPPGPPVKKSGGTALIVIGCVLLVLGIGGAGLAAALGPSAESTPVQSQTSGTASSSAPGPVTGLRVGECITNGQYSSANMAPAPADCDLPNAVYELAYESGGPTATCPDGKRENSGYAVLLNNSRILCFVLNVAEGECFQVDSDVQMFNPVDCTDPAANSKIDTIIEGPADLTLCPGGARGAAIPQPPRTYCVVPP